MQEGSRNKIEERKRRKMETSISTLYIILWFDIFKKINKHIESYS